uniref:Uncharacterized protein n=1 Tax=Otus sunia TaxID=257818 RepID=A0A8C8AD50_9STRI
MSRPGTSPALSHRPCPPPPLRAPQTTSPVPPSVPCPTPWGRSGVLRGWVLGVGGTSSLLSAPPPPRSKAEAEAIEKELLEDYRFGRQQLIEIWGHACAMAVTKVRRAAGAGAGPGPGKRGFVQRAGGCERGRAVLLGALALGWDQEPGSGSRKKSVNG